MDTPQDIALAKIEERIRKNRDTEACNNFQAVSKDIELCNYCGWEEPKHAPNEHVEK